MGLGSARVTEAKGNVRAVSILETGRTDGGVEGVPRFCVREKE